MSARRRCSHELFNVCTRGERSKRKRQGMSWTLESEETAQRACEARTRFRGSSECLEARPSQCNTNLIWITRMAATSRSHCFGA